MPFCQDVSGSYRTGDNFHELVLIQDEDRRLFGLYRNVSVFVYLGLLGDMGHPDYDSRVIAVTHAGRETALTLSGIGSVFTPAWFYCTPELLSWCRSPPSSVGLP